MTRGAGEIKAYLGAYLALMVLLLATIVIAQINIGLLQLPAALAIAALKALLILLFFMELRYAAAPIKISVIAVTIWTLIFALLSFADYVTRPWPLNPTIETSVPRNLITDGHGGD